jgi:uncharacterized protein
MKYLERELAKHLRQKLIPNKVLMIHGARRVGKTVLIKHLLSELEEDALILNGDDIGVHGLLSRRSAENYRQLLGSSQLLFIDEAQLIPDIGQILKLMIDEISGLKIIVTGSSSFDIQNRTGEPLTGRKHSFRLYPLSDPEFDSLESELNYEARLYERLVFGNYPELIHLADRNDKIDYLKDLVSSYLLKDLLQYEDIRSSRKVFDLLRLIAFQIGKEVSLQELGSQLAMSKNTVEKYLDLMEKFFILVRINGYSRNLRKEITKNSRWYFVDNGIRNALIANFQPIGGRNDIGQLWENYLAAERIKFQENRRVYANNYFWRTYDKQEIDWIEERDGQLFAYEFKWQSKKSKIPPQWQKAYPEAHFETISIDNYRRWIRELF